MCVSFVRALRACFIKRSGECSREWKRERERDEWKFVAKMIKDLIIVWLGIIDHKREYFDDR